jgi:ParB/RepB/Spo0J family partition protein
MENVLPGTGEPIAENLFEFDALPVRMICPAPHNHRFDFNDDGLSELASSIRRHGVQNPIVVRRVGDPFDERPYEIVSGERRYRAVLMVGLADIPATIRDVNDIDAAMLSLVENLHRRDINPIEEARGFERLQCLGMLVIDIAAQTGRRQPDISKRIALLRLPDSVQMHIAGGKLSGTHGVVLGAITGQFPEEASRLGDLAALHGWSTDVLTRNVREFEEAHERANQAAARKIQPELFPSTPPETPEAPPPAPMVEVPPTAPIAPSVPPVGPSGGGYANRPPGQGSTWFQWCQLVGLTGGSDAWEAERIAGGVYWQAYERGLKPSEYRVELAKLAKEGRMPDQEPEAENITPPDHYSDPIDEGDDTDFDLEAPSVGAPDPEPDPVVTTVAAIKQELVHGARPTDGGVVSPLAMRVLITLWESWNKHHPDKAMSIQERLETILLSRAEQAGIDTEALMGAANG